MDKMPRVGTAVLVFNNKKNVLLAKRLNGANAGTWSPPGGKLDFGENIKDAMLRECKEETDLKIPKIQLHTLPLVTRNMTDDGNHYVCFWGCVFLDTNDDFIDYTEYKDNKPKTDGIWMFLKPEDILERHKAKPMLFGATGDALIYYLHFKGRIIQESLNFNCWA